MIAHSELHTCTHNLSCLQMGHCIIYKDGTISRAIFMEHLSGTLSYLPPVWVILLDYLHDVSLLEVEG